MVRRFIAAITEEAMAAGATSKALINPIGALPGVIRGRTIHLLMEAELGNLPHLLQVFQAGVDGVDKATSLGQATRILRRRIFHQDHISKLVDTPPLLHPLLPLSPSRMGRASGADRLSTPTTLVSIATTTNPGTIGTAPPIQTTDTMTVTTIVVTTVAEALVMGATGAVAEVETPTGVEVTTAIYGGDDLAPVCPFYEPIIAIPKRVPILGAGPPLHPFHFREWVTHTALISLYFCLVCKSLRFLCIMILGTYATLLNIMKGFL